MNFLTRIVEDKKIQLNETKKSLSLEELKQFPFFKAQTRGFYETLNRPGIKIVAEIKQASPSKGMIVENFNPVQIAKVYESSGCDAISVLTEDKYFKGSLGDLEAVKKISSKPILRKDFIFDEYQIFEAKAYGADALLLICNILKTDQLKNLIRLTKNLGMDALVEVHDEEDLEKAIDCQANIIGINNRNLETFKVELSTTVRLSAKITGNVLKVSESGVKTPEDITLLNSSGVSVFLIGESILKSKNISEFINSLKNQRDIP
jgi:indole-3-glycerol phosphate synthase